jgi:hypothetical protein
MTQARLKPDAEQDHSQSRTDLMTPLYVMQAGWLAAVAGVLSVRPLQNVRAIAESINQSERTLFDQRPTD